MVMICIFQRSWGKIWHVMMRSHQDTSPHPKWQWYVSFKGQGEDGKLIIMQFIWSSSQYFFPLCVFPVTHCTSLHKTTAQRVSGFRSAGVCQSKRSCYALIPCWTAILLYCGTAKHDDQYFNLDDNVMHIYMFWLLFKICFSVDDHVMRITMLRSL